MKIIEIKEDVKIVQDDKIVVLEKGDKVRVLQSLDEKEYILDKITYESLIQFYSEIVDNIPNLYRTTDMEFSLKSRSEKIQVDFLINYRSLDVYSPREDIYCSFNYNDIKRIAINPNGFVVISKSNGFLIRVHL